MNGSAPFTDLELRARTIMIVDDEPSNVLLLETLFSREGFSRLVSVTDPADALQVFIERAPHLVLLDLMMPGIDGYEILESLRRHTPADQFRPVLVLTADRTQASRHRALALGAKDFVTKPLDLVEVMLRATNLLETGLLYETLADARPPLAGKGTGAQSGYDC